VVFSCHSLSDIPLSHRPKICVYVPAIDPDTLKAVFQQYAHGGFLGLYLPARKSQPASTFIDWDKHSLPIKGKAQVELLVSPFSERSVCDFGVSLSPFSFQLLIAFAHSLWLPLTQKTQNISL